MERTLLIIAALIICVNLSAQLSQRAEARMQRSAHPRSEQRSPVVERFTEIPGLTAEQHEKMMNVLSKQRQELSSLDREKHALIGPVRGSRGEQPDAKTIKKIAKIDGKIKKIHEKSDKDLRKILSEEQYQVFAQRRHNIEVDFPDRAERRPVSMRGSGPEHGRPGQFHGNRLEGQRTMRSGESYRSRGSRPEPPSVSDMETSLDE